MKISILITILSLVISTNLSSQISYGGIPKSFVYNNNISISTIKMDVQNARTYISEDVKRDEFKDNIWRFGINIPVNIDIKKQATVENIANGKMYRLRIYSEGAVSINFRFDNYKLPKGASLFVYNDKQDDVLGSFTSENNKEHGILGVSLLFTDAITIEYFEPNNAEFEGVLQIDRVTHGYRSSYEYNTDKAFGSSGSCNNDVVCTEADPWNYEINSVAMIVVGGNGFCTGSLVNNTAEDETPYFLTANHCNNSPNDWVFWFNWHREGCQTGVASDHDDISGAILKAKNADSDFRLVELSVSIPDEYQVFYAGWDKRDIASTTSVGIHHPSGDVKKISWDNDPSISSDYDPGAYLPDSHWKITAWDDGTTEGGSSGSPLFNQNHRIIGQLHGGWASCSNVSADYYGKFSMSWNRSADTTKQLQYWLDPIGTNPDYIDGYAPTMALVDAQLLNIESPNSTYCDEDTITPKMLIKNLGEQNLISCNVSYIIDGGVPVTFAWTGNLETFEDTVVSFSDIILNFGTHSFKAYVGEPNGITDTINGNDTLTKSYEVINITQQILPIQQDFEDANFPPTGWEIYNPNNSVTWERNTSASGNGSSTAAAYINFFDYSLRGATDDLLSPWFELPINTTPKLTFNVAHHRYSATWNDGMEIFVTNNCGSTWTEVYSKFGDAIATGSNQTTEFIPNQESNWRTDTVDLSAFAGQQLRIKFKSSNDYGNNLFIDDISIDYVTGVADISTSSNIVLYPNPASNFVVVKSEKITIENIQILDIAGKIVIYSSAKPAKNIRIDISNLKAGVYFINIGTEKSRIVKKLIVK